MRLTGDYKYDAQMMAEEMACELYGEDVNFYDLPAEEQTRLYVEAELRRSEALWERAERYR